MNDAGDEFSDSAKRSASTALRVLLEKALGKAPSFKVQATEHREKAGIDSAGYPRISPSDARFAPGDVFENEETLRAWAGTDEDLEFLVRELEKAGVSFTVHEERSRERLTWRVDVPAKEAKPVVSVHAPFSKRDVALVPPKADDEIVSLLAFFDRDRALSPSTAAPSQSAPIEGKRASIKFSPGSPENDTLGFGTVGWDPKARIIAGPLERHGIPFAMRGTDSRVVFEFHREDAPFIVGLADRYVEEGKLDPSRFDGLERLRQKAPRKRDRVLGTEVSDPVAANIVRDCLAEAGVPFESWLCPEEGVERFLVGQRDLAARSEEVERALQARRPAMIWL